MWLHLQPDESDLIDQSHRFDIIDKLDELDETERLKNPQYQTDSEGSDRMLCCHVLMRLPHLVQQFVFMLSVELFFNVTYGTN